MFFVKILKNYHKLLTQSLFVYFIHGDYFVFIKIINYNLKFSVLIYIFNYYFCFKYCLNLLKL